MDVFTDVPWTNVAVSMAISFAFWYAAGYVIGGDKWAPALIGAAVSGIRAVIAGEQAVLTLPDNLGVISATGYESGRDGFNFVSMTVSAGVTFVFWIFVGYFVISGSAWKYATTAAVVAALGGLFKQN
jgi:hypothetical protein